MSWFVCTLSVYPKICINHKAEALELEVQPGTQVLNVQTQPGPPSLQLLGETK